MIRAAMEGKLENVRYEKDPVFGLAVPSSCPEVPDELLMPRNTWEDKEAYDAEAQKLLAMFEENFRKFA
jgi:phosphoenolpyruvate carboxykinase (ATP)